MAPHAYTRETTMANRPRTTCGDREWLPPHACGDAACDVRSQRGTLPPREADHTPPSYQGRPPAASCRTPSNNQRCTLRNASARPRRPWRLARRREKDKFLFSRSVELIIDFRLDTSPETRNPRYEMASFHFYRVL